METNPWLTHKESRKILLALMLDVAPNQEAVAEDFDIDRKTLYNWRKELRLPAVRRPRPGPMPPPSPELQAVFAYLRRLAAAIQPPSPELPALPPLPPLPPPPTGSDRPTA